MAKQSKTARAVAAIDAGTARRKRGGKRKAKATRRVRMGAKAANERKALKLMATSPVARLLADAFLDGINACNQYPGAGVCGMPSVTELALYAHGKLSS